MLAWSLYWQSFRAVMIDDYINYVILSLIEYIWKQFKAMLLLFFLK